MNDIQEFILHIVSINDKDVKRYKNQKGARQKWFYRELYKRGFTREEIDASIQELVDKELLIRVWNIVGVENDPATGKRKYNREVLLRLPRWGDPSIVDEAREHELYETAKNQLDNATSEQLQKMIDIMKVVNVTNTNECSTKEETESVALKTVHKLQNEMVEHKDFDTPSHHTNEALGDIIRELTKFGDPMWIDRSYIREKINKITDDANYLSDMPIWMYNEMKESLNDPETKKILTGYLSRNEEFTRQVEQISPLPDGFKEIILAIVNAQVEVSSWYLKFPGSKRTANELASYLLDVVKQVKDFLGME